MAATRPMVENVTVETAPAREVEVDTPSRLHFTLIDLHGGLGRIDGGIGIALRSPRIRICIRTGEGPKWSKYDDVTELPQQLGTIFNDIKDRLGYEHDCRIKLIETIPEHTGLGSNTQLALAVAKALTMLSGLDLDSTQLALLSHRGGTSGIGVATFAHGGFVLDAGHSVRSKPTFSPSHYSNAEPPKLILHHRIPESWYFVLTTPHIGAGLHGKEEAEVFRNNCPIPRGEVEALSHLILMKLLPAVVEEDIASFGEALDTIQGIGFKRIENGLQHQIVRSMYEFYHEHGALGAGLSSFGPTTYALVDGRNAAEKLKTEIAQHLRDLGVTCNVQYTNVDNEGAKVRSS